MLQGKAVLLCLVAYPDPVYVSLAHMPESLSLIEVVMDLPFDNGFEVLLHLSACYVDHHTHRHHPTFFEPLLPVLADDYDLVVFDLLKLFGSDPLKRRCSLTAELDKHIFLTNPFSFKGGTVGHRNRRLFNDDLETPDFYRF